MKRFLLYFLVAVFSIFVGGQITEAVLLVPYWQSLSSNEFYSFYKEFGPSIGRFYTILTIVAALIPISISAYCKLVGSSGLTHALVSSFFALLFIACFYVYFKEANDLFYQAALSGDELKSELVAWSTWHWGRVVLEVASLLFLMLSLGKIQEKNINRK